MIAFRRITGRPSAKSELELESVGFLGMSDLFGLGDPVFMPAGGVYPSDYVLASGFTEFQLFLAADAGTPGATVQLWEAHPHTLATVAITTLGFDTGPAQLFTWGRRSATIPSHVIEIFRVVIDTTVVTDALISLRIQASAR